MKEARAWKRDREAERRIVVLCERAYLKASRMAFREGLSLSEYLSKAVDTDIAVAEISREKIAS